MLLVTLCVFMLDLNLYSQDTTTNSSISTNTNTDTNSLINTNTNTDTDTNSSINTNTSSTTTNSLDSTNNKNVKLIKLIQADYAKSIPNKRNMQSLVGNIIFKHDSTIMYCDSAVFDRKNNNIEAFGNVRFIENDTITLIGRYLYYQGNIKLAEIRDDVKLEDPSTTLITNILFYDRNEQRAYYTTGAQIINADKYLESIEGNYFINTKDFTFYTNVLINNPDYELVSDTVYYNTNTEVAKVKGPTLIYTEDNTLYCEKGIYDSKNKKSYLSKNLGVYYEEYIVFADSAYHKQNPDYLEAYNNVIVIDTSNNIKAWSDYLEYDDEANYAYISDKVVIRYIDKPKDKNQPNNNNKLSPSTDNINETPENNKLSPSADTSFIFCDTLMAYFYLENNIDSIENNSKKTSNRISTPHDSINSYYLSDSTNTLTYNKQFEHKQDSITPKPFERDDKKSEKKLEKAYFYHNAKLFNNDAQGACDSAIYNSIDSILVMYKMPALWFGSNEQITGDSIVFYFNDSTLKYIVSENNGFLLSVDKYGSYNQIRGKKVLINLKDEQIDKINVYDNARSIYFLREDNGDMIGPSFINSDNIELRFSDKELKTIIYNQDANFEVIPYEQSNRARESLEGLKWRGEEKIPKESTLNYTD